MLHTGAETFEPAIPVWVYGADGPVLCYVNSFESYFLARQHVVALREFMEWGVTGGLVALDGQEVITAGGTRIPLLTKPDVLQERVTWDGGDDDR